MHDDDVVNVELERDLDLDAIAEQPDETRLLAEPFRSIFFESSSVFSITCAEAEAPCQTVPAKICPVARQAATTIESSTSTPSRFSLNKTWCAF
jgi:hypothetical protein